MQVDPPSSTQRAGSPSPFHYPSTTSFEDFFNFDLSPSSASALSPNFGPLPPIPSQPFAFPQSSPPPSTSDFFGLYLDEDETAKAQLAATNVGSTAADPSSFDFLGFNPLMPLFNDQSASQSSAPASAGSPSSPSDTAHSHSPLGIDPQLVGTPATSKAPSDFGDDDNDVEYNIQHDEPEDDDATAALKSVMEPVKVGGKGKARRGTVATGGVAKRSTSVGANAIPSAATPRYTSAVVRPTSGKENSHAGGSIDGDDEQDDWRPSPEEYKKMSSKEKRQLRNKISARNFRVRRKEYISTLEGDLAERDKLLDAIRTELGSTRSENVALRQEISALKKALLGGRGVGTLTPIAEGASADVGMGLVLPPPALLPERAPTAAAAAPAQQPQSAQVKINTQKDLPTSPRARGSPSAAASSPFWGGLVGAGGVTPVHTALIPDDVLRPLTLKEQMNQMNQGAQGLQENMNPALNAPGAPMRQDTKLIGMGGVGMGGASAGVSGGWDMFLDRYPTPFTFKAMDKYRMALWERMAAQQLAAGQGAKGAAYPGYNSSSSSSSSSSSPSPAPSAHSAHTSPASSPSSSPLTSGAWPALSAGSPLLSPSPFYQGPLAGGLRPLFFTARKPLAPVSGNYSASSSSSSSSSSSPNSANGSSGAGAGVVHVKKEEAALAAMASTTLVAKLGSAFWEAFSGSSGHSPAVPAGARKWDAEKVRRVLEGRAVVRVVDVDAPAPKARYADAETQASAVASASASSLAAGLAQAGGKKGEKSGVWEAKSCVCALDALEEGIRGLTLGRK